MQHCVVLHQDNMSMFGLLSVDSEEGSLAIVTRDMGLRHNSSAGTGSANMASMVSSLHSLLEGFVEACSFHAWSLLL